MTRSKVQLLKLIDVFYFGAACEVTFTESEHETILVNWCLPCEAVTDSECETVLFYSNTDACETG